MTGRSFKSRKTIKNDGIAEKIDPFIVNTLYKVGVNRQKISNFFCDHANERHIWLNVWKKKLRGKVLCTNAVHIRRLLFYARVRTHNILDIRACLCVLDCVRRWGGMEKTNPPTTQWGGEKTKSPMTRGGREVG